MDNEFLDINNRNHGPRHAMKKKKPINKRLFTLRIVSGTLSVITLLMGVGFIAFSGIINNYTNYKSLEEIKKENTVAPSPNIPDSSESFEEIELFANSNELLSDDYVLNIMLFGTNDDVGLSDTMLLLSIDTRHRKIKLTSFLRDIYVAIPDYESNKLNAAFAFGGPPLSIETIQGNFGIKIDRYAMVTFSTFKKIVDILGGVEIELTEDEIGYINMQIRHNGQSEYLDATEGKVTLNGQQALWYARNRGEVLDGYVFEGNDFDRTDRQQNFINAVIDQLKSATLSELIGVANAIGPNVTTDLKKTELTMLLSNGLTFLNYDIEKQTIPSKGTWSFASNHAGEIIRIDDWSQLRLDLAKFLYEDSVVN